MLARSWNKKAVVLLWAFFFYKETTDALSVDTTTPAASNPPVAFDDAQYLEVERAMIQCHAKEVAGGKDVFHRKNPDCDVKGNGTKGSPSKTWNDDDFTVHDIGENNAGMDATYLPKNGNRIFESVSPVLTKEECNSIIEEARATIAKGLLEEEHSEPDQPQGDKQRVGAISNSQLGEARISEMPKTRAWLRERLPALFYPLLKDRFGVDNLVLYDGLVLGNVAPSRSQPIHRDASLVTLNIALSGPEDYNGGGTYIEALDDILKIDQGHLLCHAGSAMHAGNAIDRGERWVFVLFLLGEDQPQVSRRCHAQAIQDLRNGDPDSAEGVLRTGLRSIAPKHDHLLHNTLGRLQLAKDPVSKAALESFRLADAAYPICPTALTTMATLLVNQRRPRAALRRFDVVLGRIGSRDLDPLAQMSLKSLTYGARRDAARCALVCADHLYRSQQEQQKQQYQRGDGEDGGTEAAASSSSSWASWTLRHLPTAINRMNTCLAAAPNEPMLLGMRQRAEFLCVEAEAEMQRIDSE